MPHVPEGHRVITLVVPSEIYERLDDLRQDNAVRTMQGMLAPVVCAFSRGEIRQEFIAGAKS